MEPVAVLFPLITVSLEPGKLKEVLVSDLEGSKPVLPVVDADSSLDAGMLEDVLLPLPGLVLDTDGRGAPEDTVCPLETGKVKDILLPGPDMVFEPEGLGGMPEEIVLPFDAGRLEAVPVGIVCPGKLNEVFLPRSFPEWDADGLGDAPVENVDCPLDTGKLKETPVGMPVTPPLETGKLNDAPSAPEGTPVEPEGASEEELFPAPVGTPVGIPVAPLTVLPDEMKAEVEVFRVKVSK